MSFIKFTQQQLTSLDFFLHREVLQTNRTGAYSCSTVVGCNTRKYHGLLICPMETIDHENQLILSSLDTSVIQHNKEFNLAIHQYPGVYEPKGHKYIHDFSWNKTPKTTYRVGGVVLQVEHLLSDDDRVIVKYSLVDAHSPTTLRFRPFVACRNVHKIQKANLEINKRYSTVDNGIRIETYKDYKPLYFQLSKEAEYTHAPDWYYNIEYRREKKRGYEYQEDLYVPGFFETIIKKGRPVYFTASFTEIEPKKIGRKFSYAKKCLLPRQDYPSCLRAAARQFFSHRNNRTEVTAGFPWFGRWGRDTFIALPGLCIGGNNKKLFAAVLDTMTKELQNGLFPNIGAGSSVAMNSVDAPLWFFWSLQQYEKFSSKKEVWQKYGSKMKHILHHYRQGTYYNIKMADNYLIQAGEEGKALTWMDAIVNGKPVTPRTGFCVEINGLWYNAVNYCLELADVFQDSDFKKDWQDLPPLIKESFLQHFYSEERGYLADYIQHSQQDWAIRPNQIFACSLPYSPLEEEQKTGVIDTVKKHLLTPKGLRTLSPNHPDFIGRYQGSQEERDRSYHQGTVWPWLLGHFCEAYLQVRQQEGLALMKKIFNNFQEDIFSHGVGSISEIYDGNPPHNPHGAISQAWSVAEVVRIGKLIEEQEEQEET